MKSVVMKCNLRKCEPVTETRVVDTVMGTVTANAGEFLILNESRNTVEMVASPESLKALFVEVG